MQTLRDLTYAIVSLTAAIRDLIKVLKPPPSQQGGGGGGPQEPL